MTRFSPHNIAPTAFLATILAAIFLVGCSSSPEDEVARWEGRAEVVSITRDDWGIPHVHGPTDADAIFGMMYAQAEDDFNRVETNFINSMGRMAEAEGEESIYLDLRMKLFIDPVELEQLYDDSPRWLRDLMDGWADGLNYYLHTHPDVHSRVITRFEPWMALSFSEGSIGGDIERINLRGLEDFYGGNPRSLVQSRPAAADAGGPESQMHAIARESSILDEVFVPDAEFYSEPTGSNGFAIAPSMSATGEALLWINPHTSFFFREEIQVTSDEGLNAYGAVTWGQFFVYQGFNEDAGWMHTSSGVDNIDEFLETIVERDGQLFYIYGSEEREVETEDIVVPYLADTGMAEKVFTVYRTHHGPIVRAEDGSWVSIGLMDDPMNALIQSFTRTKAHNLAEYRANMDSHTNSSNNTVYADSEGNIAYWHSNFIPRRNTSFDYTAPVDGSDPRTDWDGVLSIDETPNVFNPANGWIQNTNNWPFSASGQHSPKQEDYPVYVQTSGENARGINAVRVLGAGSEFTLESLTQTAFDPYLSAFAEMIPMLIEAYDSSPGGALKGSVAGPIAVLRDWNYSWAVDSVPTTLAVYFGEAVRAPLGAAAREAGLSTTVFMTTAGSRAIMLSALAEAKATLEADFGTWEVAWGDINRFQRLTGDIVQPFDDNGPSIPVAFTSSRWGSLASFGASTKPGTKKRYGTSGNSFVAAVAFGDSVRAYAITAGGLDSRPESAHFNDQAERYAAGELRKVYFYPSELVGHVEETYKPGAR
ncbi:MAG: acyl-homoserine-lactone acylase [Rhodothermales bacterium]|jgi:acyl-homoserine-lactone acylase